MSITAHLDPDRAVRVPGPLAPFVDLGVLTAADVHTARTLCRVLDEPDPQVLLAVALAVRAPRAGDVCVDLAHVRDAVVASSADRGAAPTGEDVEEPGDVEGLPWPDAASWRERVGASPVVGGDATPGPVVLEGDRLYLQRYHAYEREVAAALRRRALAPDPDVDQVRLGAMLDRLFPGRGDDDQQRRAVATAARRRLTVVAGGPGTGKTWTVARILAALVDQAMGSGRDLLVGLAAPTGKAAARLEQGLRTAIDEMDLDPDLRSRVAAVDRGRTLHSLLGPRGSTRFLHDAENPLPHDVLVVDETSMASLSLVAHLLRATRPGARLVLVGDPDQLASVEAGSVLGDVVRPASTTRSPLREAVVTLDVSHRFGERSGVGVLARAIRDGDADAVLDALIEQPDLTWVDTPDADLEVPGIRDELVARGQRLVAAAGEGRAADAVAALDENAVLCAHRRGRTGVQGWNRRVDRWLALGVDRWQAWVDWQPGRPVLVTENDRTLGVFNGDVGVVVATDQGLRVAFGAATDGHEPLLVAAARMPRHDVMHAMTIHKSQGSQWRHVVVSLPDGPSRILTRELLYTAVTRATDRVTVVGDAATIRAAVERPVRRASGLPGRLALEGG